MTNEFETRILDEFKKLNSRLDGVESTMATREDIADMATKSDIVNMATKDDIVNMATKDDIVNMATKEDLAGMASKEDLAGMATKEDMYRIEAKAEVLNEGQKGIRNEIDTRFNDMNTRFTGLENVVHTIHGQTVRNSELASPIIHMQERLDHCELDIESLKRQVKP